MLLFMRHLYKDNRMDAVIIDASVIVFALAFLGIRSQTPIVDAELVRAMIPYHSGAILICGESQRQEIAQMQAWLARN